MSKKRPISRRYRRVRRGKRSPFRNGVFVSYSHRYRYKSSRNHWHVVNKDGRNDGLSLSKINLRDVEILWLESNIMDYEIKFDFVEGYQHFPAYKKGEWDGKAWIITFPDNQTMIHFRSQWWSRRA